MLGFIKSECLYTFFMLLASIIFLNFFNILYAFTFSENGISHIILQIESYTLIGFFFVFIGALKVSWIVTNLLMFKYFTYIITKSTYKNKCINYYLSLKYLNGIINILSARWMCGYFT